MANQSVTPADIFADLLRFRAPAAIAWVRGGDAAPNLSGLVKFYQTPYSALMTSPKQGTTTIRPANLIRTTQATCFPFLETKVMPGFPSMTSASPQMTLSAGPSSFTVMPTTLHPSPPETPGPKSDVVSLKKRII